MKALSCRLYRGQETQAWAAVGSALGRNHCDRLLPSCHRLQNTADDVDALLVVWEEELMQALKDEVDR